MKYFVILSLLTLGYFTYDALSGKSQVVMSDEEFKDALKASMKDNDELKKSFEKVMHVEEGREIASTEGTVETYHPDDMPRPQEEDPVTEMNKLHADGSQQLLQYVQFAVVDDRYDSGIRMNLIDEYALIEADKSKVIAVTRNVLESTEDVDLFTRALTIQAQFMSAEEFKLYQEQLVYRVQHPECKEILMNFKQGQ
jgi:hypothetical protein